MKKIIILVVIFIVLLLSFIYIYIPSQLQINETVRAACAQVSANRSLSDSTQWQHWWPGEKANGLYFRGRKLQAVFSLHPPAFAYLSTINMKRKKVC